MTRGRAMTLAIVAGAVSVFAVSVRLLRNRRTVANVAWMQAMIRHHSIAILTGEHAWITDPRLREPADRIIGARPGEIAAMKGLSPIRRATDRHNGDRPSPVSRRREA